MIVMIIVIVSVIVMIIVIVIVIVMMWQQKQCSINLAGPRCGKATGDGSTYTTIQFKSTITQMLIKIETHTNTCATGIQIQRQTLIQIQWETCMPLGEAKPVVMVDTMPCPVQPLLPSVLHSGGALLHCKYKCI